MHRPGVHRVQRSITSVDASALDPDTAIAIGADGLPVVSYYDATNGSLKVAKCVNAECTGTATITTVDSAGVVGQYTAIAIGTDSLPVMSYYDATRWTSRWPSASMRPAPAVRRSPLWTRRQRRQ